MRATLRDRTLVVLLLAVAALVPAALGAQRVHGAVRDSASGQPVGGAVLWLTDSAGQFLARSIADENGLFAVIRLPGFRQLHVVRIGFRPVTIPVGRTPADTLVDVRLASLPLTLDAMSESRHRVCPGDKGTNAALSLWEQARAALLAMSVSRDMGAPSLVMKSFTRTTDALSHEVTEQGTHTRRVIGDRSYVSGRPAALFVSNGYMQEGHGDRTFYAPDDDVLLDPSFAETHCMRVVAGTNEHASEVGLAFEPVPERERDTLVDVKGVLWIEPTQHELHSLEYRYTALEHEADTSGGEIHFELMPNGAPMITRWVIRSARLSVLDPFPVPGIRRKLFDRRERKNVRLIAVREDGGDVVSASWPSGQSWFAPLRSIFGQLLSDGNVPVGGMHVWLDRTDDTVTTNDNGEFAFAGVIPGTYMIMAADSALGRVGVARGRRIIDVRTHDHLTANVIYEPIDQVIATRCEGQAPPAGTGVLFGKAVDPSGAPAPAVTIKATWTRAERDTASFDSRPDRELESDEQGRFAICGAPLGRTVHLHAGATAAATDVEWKQAPLLTLMVIVRPAAQ